MKNNNTELFNVATLVLEIVKKRDNEIKQNNLDTEKRQRAVASLPHEPQMVDQDFNKSNERLKES